MNCYEWLGIFVDNSKDSSMMASWLRLRHRWLLPDHGFLNDFTGPTRAPVDLCCLCWHLQDAIESLQGFQWLLVRAALILKAANCTMIGIVLRRLQLNRDTKDSISRVARADNKPTASIKRLPWQIVSERQRRSPTIHRTTSKISLKPLLPTSQKNSKTEGSRSYLKSKNIKDSWSISRGREWHHWLLKQIHDSIRT